MQSDMEGTVHVKLEVLCQVYW